MSDDCDSGEKEARGDEAFTPFFFLFFAVKCFIYKFEMFFF